MSIQCVADQLHCVAITPRYTANVSATQGTNSVHTESIWFTDFRIAVPLFVFWNGATLDGIAQLVLFKSRDDAQSFLEKDFRQRCERSRRAVANRDNTDQQREWALADHLANLQGFSATLLPTKSLIENEIDDVEEQLKSIKEWNQHHR